jgi:hypothetical protein
MNRLFDLSDLDALDLDLLADLLNEELDATVSGEKSGFPGGNEEHAEHVRSILVKIGR